jgi:D-lactate dehydrogenase
MGRMTLNVLVTDAHAYDEQYLTAANRNAHRLTYTPAVLGPKTVALASGYDALCCFVNDDLSAGVLESLAALGVRAIALRCTGYNRVDVAAAKRLGITVSRVASYSPYAVAEHAVALLLALNRHVHKAYNRTRDFNFLLAGLMGWDVHGKTVGVVGTGKIGTAFAKIMTGFGAKILAFDVSSNDVCKALGAEYVPLDELLRRSQVLSLHVPLTPETHHLLNTATLASLPRGAYVINTSRGGLIDTDALIDAVQSGHLGGVGLDVYEEEQGTFFRDLSDRVLPDATLARLTTFPNVLITGHQAFLTHEAVTTIAETTIQNLTDAAAGRGNENGV